MSSTAASAPLGRGELGATLRAWRDRTAPATAGLDLVGPRRTPGLRRGELARLAGVSRDYLTQLEQGRAAAPSAQVLGAIARALRLSPAEWDHLFQLAGLPAPNPHRMPRQLPVNLDRLVGGIAGSPVAVYDPHWDPIAWNSLWTCVMGDPASRAPSERNLARRQFLGLPTRVVRDRVEASRFETALVADLRDAAVRFPTDPDLAGLVNELRAASSVFRRLWDGRPAGIYESEAKTIDHPDEGGLAANCTVLTTRTDALRVIVYTPDGAHAARVFRRLHDGNDELIPAGRVT